MLVVWVSGLAVSRRFDKGIQKGGGKKKASKQTNKNNKTKTNKQKN